MSHGLGICRAKRNDGRKRNAKNIFYHASAYDGAGAGALPAMTAGYETDIDDHCAFRFLCSVFFNHGKEWRTVFTVIKGLQHYRVFFLIQRPKVVQNAVSLRKSRVAAVIDTKGNKAVFF